MRRVGGEREREKEGERGRGNKRGAMEGKEKRMGLRRLPDIINIDNLFKGVIEEVFHYFVEDAGARFFLSVFRIHSIFFAPREMNRRAVA